MYILDFETGRTYMNNKQKTEVNFKLINNKNMELDKINNLINSINNDEIIREIHNEDNNGKYRKKYRKKNKNQNQINKIITSKELLIEMNNKLDVLTELNNKIDMLKWNIIEIQNLFHTQIYEREEEDDISQL